MGGGRGGGSREECLNAKAPEGACHGTLQKLRTANTIQKDLYD